MTVWIEVGAGELLDRLSILQLKDERIADPAKRANVQRERAGLDAKAAELPWTDALRAAYAELLAVNTALWEVEDALREHERRGDFGAAFVALARSVYHTNDARARAKRQIDALLGSRIVEEKSYAPYSPGAPPTGG
jgi:hypothetical protein